MSKMEKILLVALEMEKQARDFYEDQARRAAPGPVKSTLEWLSRWEKEHVDLIERHLEEGGEDVTAPEETSPPAPDFPSQADPARAASELTVLRRAMNLEMDARKFYQAAADKVEDPKEKKFFKWLAGWEERHWNLLDRHYRELSREYWNEAGFSPF